ncbi:MAG: hypothetical protein AAGC92_04530 [Pseudomonadota bacterium]
MRIAVLPLGRPTFDVPFARATLAAMLAALRKTGHDITGPDDLLLDAQAAAMARDAAMAATPDLILILQVTFTDAAFLGGLAETTKIPLAIWAPPEPRLGGRLRLNAFCGLNLASHALGLRGRRFSWAYGAPDNVDFETLLSGRAAAEPPSARPVQASETGRQLAHALRGKRIGRIGAAPDGFDTCAFEPQAMRTLASVEVEDIDLAGFFDRARSTPPAPRATVAALAGIDGVDQTELDRSLRLAATLREMTREGYAAFALRCWPECFTEYGGAVCGPAAMLGEAGTPCACEADIYGALTQLALRETAQAPVFLTDLVDMDVADDSAVLWHCGQAPPSMAGSAAAATIHTNRRMPLLYEFALKPGRVTLARISQAQGVPKMVLAGGEMLARPMAFTGTSGVIRFHASIAETLPAFIAAGIEHHMALAYGEHRPALRGLAGALGLPVLEITP